MNTITKIGKLALRKLFERKPSHRNNRTVTTKVLFTQKTLNLAMQKDGYLAQLRAESVQIHVWSIELGLIDIALKPGQILAKGITRKLLKQQRCSAPSHVILKHRVIEDEYNRTAVITVFLLTDVQKAHLYDLLWPAYMKRQKGISAAYERSFAVSNR